MLRGLERILAAQGVEVRAKKVEQTNGSAAKLRVPFATVYVLDVESPWKTGELVNEIRQQHRQARFIAIAEAFRDATAFPLLRLGVKGLVVHQQLDETLPSAVAAVAAGGYWVPRPLLSRFVDSVVEKTASIPVAVKGLSRRQKDVMTCVVENLSNKEIASKLNITERTVKFHVSTLLEKFKVRRRADLILAAYQNSTNFASPHLPEAKIHDIN